MKQYLILDTETTTKNKGNPFSEGNRLCYTGFKTHNEGSVTIINHLRDGQCTEEIQDAIDSHRYLVCFNSKFDCHWLENIGVDLSRIRIFDCQYAEFLFSNQTTKYPSLNGTSLRYGLGEKLDVVATEYWDKGIDTPDIPEDILNEYLVQDVMLTEAILDKQLELFGSTERGKYRLFQLHMEDQVVLREMERNGIYYDVDNSLRLEKDASVQIENIEKELRKGYESVPINFDSVDHLSSYLYGGTISIDTRIPVGVYKTGAKIGQTRYRIVTHEHKLPRLIEPLPKSELKKEGLWSTDEQTLRQLRGAKEAKERIRLLDERSKLEKLRGTYYGGFPKKITEMVWSGNIIHSSFNQCVAVTGRLSSTQPNQQNIPPECKKLAISRFK